MACSIFSLTALAFERFFGIVFQMWKVASMRRTLLIVLVIWLAVIAISWPFLYAGTVVSLSGGVPLCVEDWGPAFDAERAPRIFTIVSFVLLYALPLLMISVLYLAIVAKVWRRRTPGNITQANRRILNKSKENVLKMSMALVFAFALGWFLIHLSLLLRDFSNVFDPCGIPSWLQTTSFLLGHANSAINCCICALFCDNFRRGFKKALSPLFSKCSRANPDVVEAVVPDIPLEERNEVACN